MNRPRLKRGLKITWTAVCGLAVVLLIVLWVRSYRLADVLYLRISQTHAVTFGSVQGGVSISPDVRYAEGYFDDAWWKLQPKWLANERPITGLKRRGTHDLFGLEFLAGRCVCHIAF
jgi:hypothetical protein